MWNLQVSSGSIKKESSTANKEVERTGVKANQTSNKGNDNSDISALLELCQRAVHDKLRVISYFCTLTLFDSHCKKNILS